MTQHYRLICHNSFFSIYEFKTSSNDALYITNLWKYAQMDFDQYQLPQKDIEGNYLNIQLPESAEYNDLLMSVVDILSDNEELKNAIEQEKNNENLINHLYSLGFVFISTRYDVMDKGNNSVILELID